MRYSHCKVHHVSLSSRLKISVRSKSERPYQDWEAHRIRYCVYLIPICLYPSSHGNAKFVHKAVIKGFSRSWCPPAPSFIQPMAPSAPRLLSAPCPHPLGVSADIWVSSPSHSWTSDCYWSSRIRHFEYVPAGLTCLKLLCCLVCCIGVQYAQKIYPPELQGEKELPYPVELHCQRIRQLQGQILLPQLQDDILLLGAYTSAC